MFKKIPILLGFLIAFNMPLAAQRVHIEISYQSFRPYIHFQLDIGSHGYNYNAYESAYLRGYMNGVNDQRYRDHHFMDLVRNINAYRAGYRDGFQDQELLIRLRGHAWYNRHRFAYDDYYAPHYAVRLWLEGLSLSFLQAPAYKLPKRWHHRMHPKVKKYRKWMAKSYYHKNEKYSRSRDIERRYKKRIRGYRQKLNNAKKQHKAGISHDRNRFRQERRHELQKEIHKQRSDRSNSRTFKKDENRRRKTVKKNSKRNNRHKKVNRTRHKKYEPSKRHRKGRKNQGP